GGGLGDPCDASRAGHAVLWWSASPHPAHLLGDDDGYAGDHRRWYPGSVRQSDGVRLRGLPFEGRDHRSRLCRWFGLRLLGGRDRRAADQLLFVAPDVPDFLGQAALDRVGAYPARAARRAWPRS